MTYLGRKKWTENGDLTFKCFPMDGIYVNLLTIPDYGLTLIPVLRGRTSLRTFSLPNIIAKIRPAHPLILTCHPIPANKFEYTSNSTNPTLKVIFHEMYSRSLKIDGRRSNQFNDL